MMASTELARYESLRDRGLQAAEADHLREAQDLLDQAWDWARDHGDRDLEDRAFCNRSAVAIALGNAAEPIPSLREILLRNAESGNCFLAAYNIARACEWTKSHKKGLFYARIARDRAYEVGRTDWIASSHNQIGNFQLAESFFGEARREYELALQLLTPDSVLRRAVILYNLGYCHVLERGYTEGFRLLYTSLRQLKLCGARRHQILARLDLCFAHLEVGRYQDAMRHGAEALRLAEEIGESDARKNALYLLGQTANMTGVTSEALRHFRQLQETYYPESPHIAEFLLAVDVRQVINLKA